MAEQTALPNFSRQNLVVFSPETHILSRPKKEKYMQLLGKKEFMVLNVTDVPEVKIEAVGHHQLITIEVGGKKLTLSGAMFKLYEPPKKMPHMEFFDKMCMGKKE